MVQELIEKLKGELRDKDSELWKMTNEKEQYKGKAEAGSTTVKSQQVCSCVCHICYLCNCWIEDASKECACVYVCLGIYWACTCVHIHFCEHFKLYDCPYINGMKYIAMQLRLYFLKYALGKVERSTA